MDDFEHDFDELDKLIAQEVAKDSPYESDKEQISSASVLEGAYSKISFFSETTWWDEEEVDEYRVNNLGLWSAVMGCEHCKNTHNVSSNQNSTTQNESSEAKKEETKNEKISESSKNWLTNTAWPASLLELYPQIPEAVAARNVSLFSNIHSEFAGDLLHLRIGNVKELIQYNRLKQDCVKNLWKESASYEGILRINSEKLQEPKTSNSKSTEDEINYTERINIPKETIKYKNEICDSFKTIITQKNEAVNKSETQNIKSEVKIKLLERRKTFTEFQKEYEKENVYDAKTIIEINPRDDFQNQGSQCKKLKTDKLENSYARKTQSKNKTSQTEGSKKPFKPTERNVSLIKENFGTFPINYQGEIIETLEEVCQWLQNVYPQKSSDENSSSTDDKINLWNVKSSCEVQNHPESELAPLGKDHQSGQITKILSRPHIVGDFTMFNQIPSRRLYRDVLANSESCMESDPVNKFAELEREAMEQYSGCSINSETSIPLLQIDEESKFKDLEREAIEQYQPEDDSVITSSELFTPSELLNHSPISTPPRANSSTRLNIFKTQLLEFKKDGNSQDCEVIGKSSSEYLLCPDDSNDKIFSQSNHTKFEANTLMEQNKLSDHYPVKTKESELKIKIEIPIRILKPPRHKDSLVDISHESLLTYKNSVYTSPYESPNEDSQLEEIGSKIVQFIMKNKQQETSEDEQNLNNCTKEMHLEKPFIEAEESAITLDTKPQESTSKQRESDEDKSGQDETKKKKKKKKRSRKKNRCKKDGGGGGGGNKRGGGGRCDARTPIHCPLPLTSKNSDKTKRKEESSKRDKKQGESTSCIPLKWQWLHYFIAKLSKYDALTSQRKLSWDNLLYDEYYLEHIPMNEINNPSLTNISLKKISSFLFFSKIDYRMSVLLDVIQYRLGQGRWSYISENDLFTKCSQCCFLNKSENIFPSSLKWCKCFALRVGQCHSICPGSILSPGTWRIPREDIFNPKYWELAAGEKVEGILVNISSLLKVESLIFSMVKNNYHINKLFSKIIFESNGGSDIKNLKENSNNLIMIKYYKNAFERNCQKIYHLCSNYNHVKEVSETVEVSVVHLKKSKNKFHRGKNNKIKGKTFCYYCSGNNFKNYTLHTFFCDVDAQNKGNIIHKSEDKMFPQTIKRDENTLSKAQQTGKDYYKVIFSNDSCNNDLKDCLKCYSSNEKQIEGKDEQVINDRNNLLLTNCNKSLTSNLEMKTSFTSAYESMQFLDLTTNKKIEINHLQDVTKNVMFNTPSCSNYSISKTRSYDDLTTMINARDFLSGTRSENEFYANFNSNNFLKLSMNKLYTQFEDTTEDRDSWEKTTDRKDESIDNFYFSNMEDHKVNFYKNLHEDKFYNFRNDENFTLRQGRQKKDGAFNSEN